MRRLALGALLIGGSAALTVTPPFIVAPQVGGVSYVEVDTAGAGDTRVPVDDGARLVLFV